MSIPRGALAAAFALALSACPPASSSSSSAARDAGDGECTREGQQCRYAEGKIGLCTAKPDATCDGGACFGCMSLH